MNQSHDDDDCQLLGLVLDSDLLAMHFWSEFEDTSMPTLIPSWNSKFSIKTDEVQVDSPSPFIKLLKFAQNYLGISTAGTIIEQLEGVVNDDHPGKLGKKDEVFCEKCDVAVVNPICQIYVQLLSLRLRLSWELDHLGGLLHSSKKGVNGGKGLRMLLGSLSRREGVLALPKVHLERLNDLPLLSKSEPVFFAEDDDFHDEFFDAGDVDCDEKDDPTFQPEEPPMEPMEIEMPPEKQLKRRRIRRARSTKTRDGQNWKCEHCRKVFLNENRFQTHQLCHHKPLSCHFCELTCNGTNSLEAHVGSEHPQEQLRLACPRCSKTYPSTVRLAQHIARFHYETRYKCFHCDFSTHTRYLFDKHLSSAHPGDDHNNPFSCKECGVSFHSGMGLGGHNARVHADKKPKPESALPKKKRDCGTGPEWQCEICGELTTNKRKHLQEHQKKSTEGKSLQCCFCHRKFSLQICLDNHLKTFHWKRLSEKGYFSCEVEECKEQFKTVLDLNSHLKTHCESDLHLCACGFGFIEENLLKLHSLLHIEPLKKAKKRYWTCPEADCEKRLQSAGLLQHHYNFDHGIRCSNWDYMKCQECSEKFGSKHQLNYHHRLTHLPRKCSVCELDLIGMKVYNEHMNVFHSEAFSCTVPTCGKRFNTEESFQTHLRSHQQPKPEKMTEELKTSEERVCQHCGKTMANKKRLQKHIKLVHQKEPHMCPHCGKVYSAKIYLSNHIIRYHPEQCEQGFKLAFQCTHCPEKFRWKSVLNRHLYKAHPDKELVDGLLECPVCKLRMESGREGLMKRHMEKHMPKEERRSLSHICHVCGREFLAIENYNSHIVTHEENQTESTLRCPICQRPFYYKHRLKTHLKTHREREAINEPVNNEGGMSPAVC
ncbi:putative zinc finger protein [Orchesella cincta]|uniref:Putative zinc finger protein n=1 Tax=Orchesella cincta TaxID=48709 RepID=A0A1D2MCX4_ORCCI|nr:putative zinc finger protein [Orchesella cincta]